MRKRAIRWMLAVCAVALLCGPSLAEGPWNWGAAELSDAREWTIMAFINGDNNLEQAALDDLKEMEAGLPAGGAVEVVITYSQPSSGALIAVFVSSDATTSTSARRAI